MTTNNPRQVMKPPRPLPGDLQTLPTLPWMFQWPMSAHERLILTNHTIYQQYPSSPCPATSHPYKDSWQFRDHSADDRVHPCHVDLRGGPKNVYNVAEKLPSQEPPQCDTRVSSSKNYNNYVGDRTNPAAKNPTLSPATGSGSDIVLWWNLETQKTVPKR